MAEDKNLETLLKRAFMFLEDGEWFKADLDCERVLVQDPENAQAYLGKLMAEFHIRRQEDLPNCEQPFNTNNNYQKAVRFGDEEFAGVLSGYIDQINERNENVRMTDIYNDAVSAMNTAKTESTYEAAAEAFKTIPGFQDADILAEQCLDKAEACRKNVIYASAQNEQLKNSIYGYESAIKLYERIPGWKDANEQIEACQQKAEELRARYEARRLDRERRAEQSRIAAKKRKRIIIITVSIAFILFICIFCLTRPPVPSSTSRNVKIIHKIYEKDKSDEYKLDDYSKKTLYNFGLYTKKNIGDKEWNGKWIITEDFIKCYVETYSADEFIEVYDLYVASYFDTMHRSLSFDEKFYDENPQLLDHITETTNIMLNSGLFDVIHCCPATDQLLNKTSKTETINGGFNVGKDNHVEYRTTELVTDTYEYDGYIVEHEHGQKYSQGEYSWKNGKFVDIPASFYSVDEYSLCVEYYTLDSGDSLNALECKWIELGDKRIYLRQINGIKLNNVSTTHIFPRQVLVFTQSPYDIDERYVSYYS